MMKKLMTLLLAAGLAFSVANGAGAVEVKPSGVWDFAFEQHDNLSYLKHNDNDKNFGAVQRLRLRADFIMSESLSATYQAQIGVFTWGGPSSGLISGMGGNQSEDLGGALGTRAANIVTRLAYLDWIIPHTNVKIRMGQQPVAVPSFTFKSSVLDNDGTGIVVSAPLTDSVGLTAFWLRTASDPRRGTTGLNGLHDTNDLFSLIGEYRYNGLTFSPWGMMGVFGRDANTRKRFAMAPDKSRVFPWWVGVSAKMTTFDPLTVTLDAYYSRLSGAGSENGKSYGQAGWYVGGGASYKTAYGAPAVKAWYATGDGKNQNKASGRPLSLAGRFNPTNLYFDNKWGIAQNGVSPDYWGVCVADGTWGVSLQWNNLSLVEKLTHSMSVTYFQGTNAWQNLGHRSNSADALSKRMAYLTTKDSAVELDFLTEYAIYKNLAAVLELGYVIENFDAKYRDNVQFSNAWRGALNFRYTY